MAEYIERETYRKRLADLEGWCQDLRKPGLKQALEMFDEIPAADAAPVVYGRWILPHWKNSNYCCDCSKCGEEAMHREYQWNKKGIYPICPNCGAKMDGKDGGEK